jgi:hypothetical protein
MTQMNQTIIETTNAVWSMYEKTLYVVDLHNGASDVDYFMQIPM